MNHGLAADFDRQSDRNLRLRSETVRTLQVMECLLEAKALHLHQRSRFFGAPVEDVAGQQVSGQRFLLLLPRQRVQMSQVFAQ